MLAQPPPDEELREHWRAFSRDDGHRNAHLLLGYMAERREHERRWVGALIDADLPKRFIWGPRTRCRARTSSMSYRHVWRAPGSKFSPAWGTRRTWKCRRRSRRCSPAWLDCHEKIGVCSPFCFVEGGG